MELDNIFIGNILVLLVFYSLGTLLLYPHNYLVRDSNPYSILFHKLFFGVLGSVTLFSLYSTRLLSINLIFLLLYIVLTIYAVAKGKVNWNLYYSNFFSDIKKLPYFIPVLLIAIFVGLFKNHYFLHDYYFTEHDDNSYYLQLARFIPITHQESVMPWNAFITDSLSFFRVPYHYGDLWLTSICLKICPFLLPMITYNFVITPVLIIIMGTVLTCLIHSFHPLQKVNKLKFPFSNFNNDKLNTFFIAFIGFLFAMYWGYTPKIPLGFINTVSIEHKTFNFIFPFSFAVFCYLQGKKTISYIALSSIFILDIVYLPILLVSLGLIVFLLLLKKDRIHLKYFLIPFSFSVFILLFYLRKESLYVAEGGAENTLFTFQYFGNSLRIITINIIKHVITCLPFYFALFYILKNKNLVSNKITHVTFFITVIIFSSILLVGFGHFHTQNWQFARTLNSSTSILLLVFLTFSFNNVKIISKRLYVVLFSIVMLQSSFAIISQSSQSIQNNNTNYFTISKKTIDKIEHFLSNENNTPMGYYADSINHTLGVTYSAYDFSGFLKNNISFFEINLPDRIAPDSKAHQISCLKSSPFYEYIQMLKQNKSYIGLENAQLSFLKGQNINYVLLSVDNSPNAITHFVVDSLLFDTSKEMLKLYKLQF